MARTSITKLSGAAARTLRASSQARLSVPPRAALLSVVSKPATSSIAARKLFTTSAFAARGIMPDSENPQVKETPKAEIKMNVVELTDAKYHELADAYLDTVVTQLEELADARESVDVEYAVRKPSSNNPEFNFFIPSSNIFLGKQRRALILTRAT